MADKYGEWIVFKPELNKHNFLLWFLPYLALIFGGIIIFIIVRGRRN
jgi:cytochrome c-type biogenesis protein CcmH